MPFLKKGKRKDVDRLDKSKISLKNDKDQNITQGKQRHYKKKKKSGFVKLI